MDKPSATFVRSLEDLPVSWRGAVVAIGNFDGVHRGHQAVLSAAMSAARHNRAPCIALTFEPHPRTFFGPDRPVFRLSPEPLKSALMKAYGIDGLLILAFDQHLAEMPAEQFVSDILVNRVGIRHAVTGYDFHFGHKRQGTPEFLVRSGVRHDFGVTVVTRFGDEEGAISSSRIRQAVSEGDLSTARDLLGWDYSFIAKVTTGEKRGRNLGYPTANMKLQPSCLLRHGIYAVRFSRVGGQIYDGVASFGRRPTFDNGAPIFETYVFDFSGDLYGETAMVSTLAYLRPEQAYESETALIAQMNQDQTAARARAAAHPADEFMAALYRAWPDVSQRDGHVELA